MPPAAGARALLSSAQTPSRARRLPRVAVQGIQGIQSVHTYPTTAAVTQTVSRSGLPSHNRRRFHTSVPSLRARPDEPPNTEDRQDRPPPADSNKDNGAPAAGNDQPPEASAPAPAPAQSEAGSAAATDGDGDANAKREKLKSAGYGSARARANRNNRVEEAPVLELPPSFKSSQISLYEERPIGGPSTALSPLGEKDRNELLAFTEMLMGSSGLSEKKVQKFKDKLDRFATREDIGDHTFQSLESSTAAVQRAAFWRALTLVHRSGAEPGHIEKLRQYHAETIGVQPMWSPLIDFTIPDGLQHLICGLRSDTRPGQGFHLSPLAKRPPIEYPVCMELLAAVSSQLATPPTPGRQDSRRPPIVLSILKSKGRSFANHVIRDLATDLKADVVHLSAHHIARIVGRHVGQNAYSARGALAMLGYGAAEMNGRLASRPSPESDQLGVVAVELPSRLRSLLSPRESATPGLFDGRWEDMKINAALETMVAAVDGKRARGPLSNASVASSPSETLETNAKQPPRDLIIHLHDYVEISSLYPSIIHKLRAIADRMWKTGRRVVFVGSSAGDMDKSPQLRDQLIELGRDGAHVIPFHTDSDTSQRENWDNAVENLHNIMDMLRGLVGDHVSTPFVTQMLDETGDIIPKDMQKLVYELLSSHVYDAQWVQRVVSLMVGRKREPQDRYTAHELVFALTFILGGNRHWEKLNPGVRPPYYSPIHSSRNTSSSSSSPDGRPINNLSGAAASKEYNSDEKKLLSGLINAKDISTTFDQIVVPQETKESLIGLTTLSLIRPEAFAYGVLKTEHISGCLLYGPPGTGKTLLAKAVAKESGANVLEVSAADINDKWVGQSEKNVQALFSLARKLAPCVIFLDEADALLAARRSGPARAAYRETITQFLREWDGLTGSRAFIMVATNRPFDLDEAVLRRLPRKILVDLPLAPEREAILRVMLREEQLAPDVDLARLAAETELYSGSDLKNLCVSAAMEAVREEVRAKEAWMRERQHQKQEQQQQKQEEEEDEGDEERAEKNGDEEYQFPERRVLTRAHFDKGLREISASISGDMQSLKAIRKFDEQYGDAGRKRRTKKGLGFEVVPPDDGKGLTGEARVRQVEAA
ncbi:hypothetical protein P885DRAFT_72136 [Corynascus similis CBS 632.67]